MNRRKSPHKQLAEAILFVLMALAVSIVLLSMTGCTVATYHDAAGRELMLLDLRLSGTATRVSVVRPDGTAIGINRDQDSPESTVTGLVNTANPIGEFMP